MDIDVGRSRIDMRLRPGRIVIIGCTNVSKESVYSLGLSGSVDEIVLIGEGKNRLGSGVEELIREFPMEYPFRIRYGTLADLNATDLVIIAVGESGDSLGSLQDRLSVNTRMVRNVAKELASRSFRGPVIVTTNPIDEMTQLVQETSRLAPERVIGVGGISALRGPATHHKEKQDLQVAAWCSAHRESGQLMDSCQPDCPYFEDVVKEFSLAQCSKKTPVDAGVGSLASCVMLVCDAIMRDDSTVLTVSAKTMGEYGIWGVYMTLPCVISRRGIERIVEFKIPNRQRRVMLDYAKKLAAINKDLKFAIGPGSSEKRSAATKGNRQ